MCGLLEMEEVMVGLTSKWVSPKKCHVLERRVGMNFTCRRRSIHGSMCGGMPDRVMVAYKGDSDRRAHVGKRETMLPLNSGKERRHYSP